MEFLYSITMYKCGVYNIPEKLHMITTFFTYYGTNLVFPVFLRIDAAKTLCMVCLPPEERIFQKNFWVADLLKSHIL